MLNADGPNMAASKADANNMGAYKTGASTDSEPLITPSLVLKAYSVGLFPMAESADDPDLIWIDPVTGEASYELRKATPQQLAALEIDETSTGGVSKRRTVRIRPKAATVELQTLLQHLGLQEVDQNAGEDRLTQAIREINERGSSAPIATAQRKSDGADGQPDAP